tara:strand:+ start:150 stop:797 length:648 start_codon:yes stop_codon:yes gene_type:complete
MSRFGIIPASVFDLDLDAADYALLSALSTFANKDGWCWPSGERLGHMVGRSKAWVSDHLRELEDAGVIEISQKGRKLIFRLVYDVQPAELIVQPAELDVQPAEPNNRKNNTKNTLKRARAIPDDFAPSENDIKWWSEQFADVDIKRETAQFIDHAKSKNRLLIDWNAGWRNWIRKAQEFTNVRPLRRKPPDLAEIHQSFQAAKDLASSIRRSGSD